MSKRIHHKQIINFMLLFLCAAMMANTAFAAEAVNLGGDGKNALIYGTTLADGRILMVGSLTATGKDASSARMVCLNRNGTVSWEYMDEACDNGRFSYAAELEDGTIGLVFWKLEDGGKTGYVLRFFTADGKPTGKEVIISGEGYDDIVIRNATKSRLQMICETVTQEATETEYKTVRTENYLIDWDGNKIRRFGQFDVSTGFCTMIEETDGLVMTGYGLAKPIIMKTDFMGNPLWKTKLQCVWQDTSLAEPEHIIRMNDGGYIVLQSEFVSADWKEKSEKGIWEYRSALVKLDSEGNILWTSTEGFEDNTDMCEESVLTGGKIAVSFVRYDLGPESYRIDNPRTIAWFDENGKPLGNVELEIDPKYVDEAQKALRKETGAKELLVMLYEDQMIPLEDGLWMTAQIVLYNAESNSWLGNNRYICLFKVPEP